MSKKLSAGDRCVITVQRGVNAYRRKGKVISYEGNDQYIVELKNGNRYLRYLDSKGREKGIDKIRRLLMSASDMELLEVQKFIKQQLRMLH